MIKGIGGKSMTGFRFFAVYQRIKGMASFPVKAFAIVE
jgi:hypothetical protein